MKRTTKPAVAPVRPDLRDIARVRGGIREGGGATSEVVTEKIGASL